MLAEWGKVGDGSNRSLAGGARSVWGDDLGDEQMKLYKLTDANGCTQGGMQWGLGVEHEATGDMKQKLCSDAWIHAYTSPLLAVMMNRAHADFINPRLWIAAGVVKKTDGLKVGCRMLKTIKEIPLPSMSTTQRVAFAVLCSLEVIQDKSYRNWAKNWLSGKDRTKESALDAAAAYFAHVNTYDAALAAAQTAYHATYHDAYHDAYHAAQAADDAAHDANVGVKINFEVLIKQAMKVKK